MLTIGQGKYLDDTCPVCGRRLLINNKCEKVHKKKNPERGRFSGKSKSENAYGNY